MNTNNYYHIVIIDYLITYNYQKWLEKFFKVLIALYLATDISV